jgi:ribosomal protein L35
MPGKSKKSITKRFRLTKKKYLMHRLPHQDHFNAKETGDEKRRKKRLKRATGTMAKEIAKFL